VILLDTNAVVYYLHRVEPYASKVKQILVEREDFAVTLRVVDEVTFTLIRLEAWKRLGVRNEPATWLYKGAWSRRFRGCHKRR